MKRTFCDCCGKEYDPNSEHFALFHPSKIPGGETSVSTTLTRNQEIKQQSYKNAYSMEFAFRVVALVKPLTSQHHMMSADREPDVCHDCLWEALKRTDKRPKAPEVA